MINYVLGIKYNKFFTYLSELSMAFCETELKIGKICDNRQKINKVYTTQMFLF